MLLRYLPPQRASGEIVGGIFCRFCGEKAPKEAKKRVCGGKMTWNDGEKAPKEDKSEFVGVMVLEVGEESCPAGENCR